MLAELSALLESPDLSITQTWDPRLRGLGARIDGHCAEILAQRAAGEERRPSQRVAALSLLRAAPAETDLPALTAGERILLWQTFDTSQPSPIVSSDLDCDESMLRVYRDSVARAAGACLAVLGDVSDLTRLAEQLDEPDGKDLLAARSLSYARSPEAIEVLLLRLADPTRRTTTTGLALAALLETPAAQDIDPALVSHVAAALLERWRNVGPDSPEVSTFVVLLGRLDPKLLAERWGELLDAGLAGRHLVPATTALVRNASPADQARIERLLGSGSEAERLAAAGAVLRHAAVDGPAAGMRTRAADALAQVLRSSSDSAIRRQALFTGMAQPGALSAAAGDALQRDEDPLVREAAAVLLHAELQRDPGVRALLEQAAATDLDDRVRRAAEQALR